MREIENRVRFDSTRPGRFTAPDTPHGPVTYTFALEMNLPAPLLDGIARAQGGAVVLITGAGVSVEPPTSLPLSKECATEAYRRLVADRVLRPGDCNNPEDLSDVADAVHRATAGQRELVIRLPIQEFRQARPNKGHQLAVALLVENALSAVITLNFDLGFEHALAMVGGPSVAIVTGPHEHDFLATASLIYLHRNANADPEKWILRTVALESEWKNSWEEVIARRILSAPVLVFVGLGSPAGVLIDAATKIQAAIPEGSGAYQVNPGPAEQCRFFAALRLSAENYLEGGWIEFMESLANRLSTEHSAALERACRVICEAEHLDCDDIPRACEKFTSKGLIHTGTLRASWTLSRDQYAPLRMVNLEQIADLLLGIRAIERVTGAAADLDENGTIRFETASRVRGYAFVASGRGVRSWRALETEIAQNWRFRAMRPPTSRALVAGVNGGRPAPTPLPESVLFEPVPGSIVYPRSPVPKLFSVQELRENQNLAWEFVDHE